ncbi:hypothetical protein D9615_009378 [Tricholomella constricta]|uniref:Mug135-like C-terminal domain-containing protein n=1 Tax=Tricholomella constricta TaxID=117010 RepID=A0A8H5H2U7_9AGAR|nr:hypothetical protein D9615_009378 [Tricholomella constricta]
MTSHSSNIMAAPPSPPPVAHPAPNDPNAPLPIVPAAAGPPAVAPPWFQDAIEHFRVEFRNEMRAMIRAEVFPKLHRLMNQRVEDGTIIPYVYLPFTNGDDPTQPPHNLPPLDNVNAIENLNEQDLAAYLTGYGINPLPASPNPHMYTTNLLQKDTLKGLIGATRF